ncbi:MAG: rod shape-determining protein, partial [Opitutaceae bacterium]|nr:rod shape-determining protein [Opitutaceae bacterium]
IGGDHFTNDLSVGLRLPTNQAENLKVRSGNAMVLVQDKKEKTWLNGDLAIGDRQISQKAIEQILSARTVELFEILKKTLGNQFKPESLGNGIVLTGGASRLPGIDEVASQVLGVPARTGESPAWVMEELSEPEFSTVLGLLNYGLNYHGEVSEKKQNSRGLLGRVKQIFATA